MSNFKVGDKCKFNENFDFDDLAIKCKNEDLTFTISYVDDDGWAYTCDAIYRGIEPIDSEGWCVGDRGFEVINK